MKLPQFSLRLMLLVVALFGTLVGWRTAVEEERRANRNGEIAGHRMTLKTVEQWREESQSLAEAGDQIAVLQVKAFDRQISELKGMIDDLRK